MSHPSPRATLEWVADAEVQLGEVQEIGATLTGRRRIIPILGGRVQGPRLDGEILTGGADWQTVADDGTAIIDTRYAMRTADDVTISITSAGHRHGPPAVLARLAAGHPVAKIEYTFDLHVRLEAPSGPYGWVNRTVFVAVAERAPSQVTYELYRLARSSPQRGSL